MKDFDVIILGAGAAGLMCAAVLTQRGKKVLLLEKSNKIGKKILMSGGGRCNFTNLNIYPENYLSHNPHFCKSALSRYTQWDFIALVEKHGIEYYEKTLGQLFCQQKAQQILDMLLSECEQSLLTIKLSQEISTIDHQADIFTIKTPGQTYQATNLVVATGGLSIPTLGGSPFGYELAKQFVLNVYPTRAALVPYTLRPEDKSRYEMLSGVSIAAEVTCQQQTFAENILFTHRGLSGPAILQISSYWQPGDVISIKLLPHIDIPELFAQAKQENQLQRVKTVLAQYAAKKLLSVFLPAELLDKELKQLTGQDIAMIQKTLQKWQLSPGGTEGYRTAEVTIGGVDCDEVSSKTFEAKRVAGLYFIGEVLDVTGWLGGYNFQWAWSSAQACGKTI